MTASVFNSSPTKVTQFGTFVMVEFATGAEAMALKQALDDAKLFRDNPAEFRRRYEEAHGITHGSSVSADVE